ncbi:MAG: hypothetical protein M3Y51_03740 [Actinomycetota bacterium]|nr:hypothetical protein [Actinomycetota bacterium]
MTDPVAGAGSVPDSSIPPAAAPGTGVPRSNPTAAAGATPATPASNEPDWTDQVTDLIVDTVDKVRDSTTGKILQASRVSVHAVVAMILLLPIAVLAIAGLVRLITYWVDEVWITYTILGTLFVLVGVVLWSRRRPSTT